MGLELERKNGRMEYRRSVISHSANSTVFLRKLGAGVSLKRFLVKSFR